MVHVGLFLYKMSFFVFWFFFFFFFSAYKCPVALQLCVEKAIRPPLDYFHTCFENQVDIYLCLFLDSLFFSIELFIYSSGNTIEY